MTRFMDVGCGFVGVRVQQPTAHKFDLATEKGRLIQCDVC
jgi:hypothetical protein